MPPPPTPLSGFKRPWQSVRRGVMYRLSLIVVSITMLIIPLVYGAFIAGVGYLVYFHAVHDTGIVTGSVTHVRGRAGGYAALLALVLYIAPIIAGGFMVIMLLRPLIPERKDEANIYTIHPNEEPELYAFVAALCQYIGAPIPKRIDLDATPNASARFDRGLWSMFLRSDLVLTIGMPLAAGMTLNQFAGVLAHEFGHFSQGAGMRAGVLINRINAWVAGVVYDRGRAQGTISDLATEQMGIAGLLLYLVLQIGVWITKLVFFILLWIAHAISCFMSRQMEFDADKHEARFVGVENFEGAFRRLLELDEGFQVIRSQLSDYWRNDRHLPDDLPAMMADASRRLSPEARARVQDGLTKDQAGFFSTHPPIHKRIARVRAAAEQGVFDHAAPASSLFRDFHGVCLRASYGYYRTVLGKRFDQATMVPTTEFLSQNAQADQEAGVAARALGFEVPTWRPMFLSVSEFVACPDPKTTYAQLVEARTRLSSAGAAAKEAAERYRVLDTQYHSCDLAEHWFGMGHTSLPKGFECPARNKHALLEVRGNLINQVGAAAASIDEALELGAKRCVCALRLLHTKGIESRVPNAAALRERTAKLVIVQAALRDLLPTAIETRNLLSRVKMMVPLMESSSTRENAMRTIKQTSGALIFRLDKVRDSVAAIDYPFPSPRGEQVTVFQHFVEAMPGNGDVQSILTASESLVERYPVLVHRILRELLAAAMEVEGALSKSRTSVESPPTTAKPSPVAGKISPNRKGG